MVTRAEREQQEKAQAIAEGAVEKVVSKDQVNEAPALEKGPAQMTLPELLSSAVKMVLENPASMATAKKNLYLWYMAQDDQDRKALAARTKKTVETLKLTGEGLFMTIVEMTAGEQ